MKYVFLLTLSLFFVFGFSQEKQLAIPSEITFRNNIAYFNGYPFTGMVIDEKTNKEIGEYKNGRKDGSFFEWHPNGKKKLRYKYLDGHINGVCEEYHTNGTLKSSVIFLNDIKNGAYTEWFDNGKTRVIYNYTQGQIDTGSYPIYRADGSIEKTEYYAYKTCEYCNGDGLENCKNCSGKGTVLCRKCSDGKVICNSCRGNGTQKCNSCEGQGKWTTCKTCKGSGYVKNAPTLGGFLLYSGTCLNCNGRGKGSWYCSVCGGNGKTNCNSCSGTGSVNCTNCHGYPTMGCSACDLGSGKSTESCKHCSRTGHSSETILKEVISK